MLAMVEAMTKTGTKIRRVALALVMALVLAMVTLAVLATATATVAATARVAATATGGGQMPIYKLTNRGGIG